MTTRPPDAGTGGEPAVADPWLARADDRADAVRAAGRWRAPRTLDGDPIRGRLAGAEAPAEVIAFASNDYLGLARHPDVVAAAHAALDRWGTGAGASRLVVGSRPVHDDLEAALAEWRGTEAAVLFPTGYAANLGALTTFATAGTRILSDELNHASLIDGCRLARAEVAVYPHLDLDRLASLLAERPPGTQLVVTDLVFSMDGDSAPVDELLTRCARHDALLVLDTAHAVLGPDLPTAAEAACTVIQIGTLSKALGALGGYVAGPRALTQLLVNEARPYIFTTAPTPADTAAALAAVGVVRSAEGDRLRNRLRGHVDRLVSAPVTHPSPIVPVVVGSEEAAMALSAALLERGLLVPAIRPPTVPAGTSRLRVALSAAHRADEVDTLRAALGDLAPAARWPATVGR